MAEISSNNITNGLIAEATDGEVVTTSPDIVYLDSLTPAPYTEPIMYPSDYENKPDDKGVGVIGDNLGIEVGKEANAFCIEPVIPISYANNKLYDKVNDAFEDVSSTSTVINSNINYKEYISYAIANSKTDVFHYLNSIYSEKARSGDYSDITNSFLMKYEDITCKSKAGSSFISLDENTNIDKYIQNIQSSGDITANSQFTKKSDYTGAFLYPDLDNISQVMTEGNERSNILIKPGESISIPLTFEYFLPKDTEGTTSTSTDAINKISKKLIFVIKDSIMSSGRYFELEVTGNQSNNFTDSIYTSIDNYTLDDSLTEN